MIRLEPRQWPKPSNRQSAASAALVAHGRCAAGSKSSIVSWPCLSAPSVTPRSAKSRYAGGRSGRAVVRAGREGQGPSALRRKRPLGERRSSAYELLRRTGWPDLTCPRLWPSPRNSPLSSRESATRVYWNIASRLAAESPAEAERVLRLIPQEPGKIWLPPAIAWKMAATDPARARRLVDEAQRDSRSPAGLFVPGSWVEAARPRGRGAGVLESHQGIDRQIETGDGVLRHAWDPRWVLLPLVEQIDPTLVPELFWRAVATRPPIGNPRRSSIGHPSGLVILAGLVRPGSGRGRLRTRSNPDRADRRSDIWPISAAAPNFRPGRFSIPAPRRPGSSRVPVTVGSSKWRISEGNRCPDLSDFPTRIGGERLWSQYTEMRDLLERDIR